MPQKQKMTLANKMRTLRAYYHQAFQASHNRSVQGVQHGLVKAYADVETDLLTESRDLLALEQTRNHREDPESSRRDEKVHQRVT